MPPMLHFYGMEQVDHGPSLDDLDRPGNIKKGFGVSVYQLSQKDMLY